jgi:hypothetical protein
VSALKRDDFRLNHSFSEQFTSSRREKSDRPWRCESIVQCDPGEGGTADTKDRNSHPNPLPSKLDLSDFDS